MEVMTTSPSKVAKAAKMTFVEFLVLLWSFLKMTMQRMLPNRPTRPMRLVKTPWRMKMKRGSSGAAPSWLSVSGCIEV